MNRTERIDFTAMFIRDAMDEIAKITFFDAEHWPGLPIEDTIHKPLGFVPPLLIEGTFFAFVSPAVVVNVGAHLEDDEFVDFLCWVKAHMQLHVTHFDLAPEDREIRVETELFAMSPATDATAAAVRERIGA